jgi:hypothetical protein
MQNNELNQQGLDIATKYVNDAWDKTSRYLIEDAIKAYLPYHNADSNKMVELVIKDSDFIESLLKTVEQKLRDEPEVISTLLNGGEMRVKYSMGE